MNLNNEENPIIKSRKFIAQRLRKKGYKLTLPVHVGDSTQYWIVYVADEKNKESRLNKGEWSLV